MRSFQSTQPIINKQYDSSMVQDLMANSLILNDLIADPAVDWQIHNCKITKLDTNQDLPLPFLYHYDTLPDDIKITHPLTPALLSQFDTPMLATQVCQLLQLPEGCIQTPWQIKIVGTLVMFNEALQLALRLKFTNTAKPLQYIYSRDVDDAIKIAMQQWHFFGEVFVVYKQPKRLIVITDTHYINSTNLSSAIGIDNKAILEPPVKSTFQSDLELTVECNNSSDNNHTFEHYVIETSSQYIQLPNIFAIAILTELDANMASLHQLDDAIKLRLN